MTFEELSGWVRPEHEHLAQVFLVCPTEIHCGGCIRFVDGLVAAGA